MKEREEQAAFAKEFEQQRFEKLMNRNATLKTRMKAKNIVPLSDKTIH